MFLRTTKAKGVQYVQLAHNAWDTKEKVSKTKVIYNFGRKDKLDYKALQRLVRSIARYLKPEDQEKLQKELGLDWPFEYLGSRKVGGSYFLDGMWKSLQIDKTIKRLLKSRKHTTPVERLIFGMVCNRALAPSSKLAMEHWVAEEVMIEDLPEVEVHQLYRAMDFLLEAHEKIQCDVFFSVANLFNLEVDLIFIDTSSTYFEIKGEDLDSEDDGEGLRRRGYSKDRRPDLAQAIIAFAVTRQGIPVRCWVWPGNTADKAIIQEVKQDLNDWKLGRVITVLDTGFNSAKNRRHLQGAGDGYIIGEKLRLGKGRKLSAALQRGGTFKKLDNGLGIKEVFEDGRRFIVVRNSVEASRTQNKRDDIVHEAQRRLENLDQLTGKPHTKAACSLRSHSVFGQYIRQTKTGKLCINKGKIRDESRLDGKYLISTSEDDLSSEDVVMGYKQLHKIERVFRDLKHTVDVQPVYHSLEERIRAHVLLCWLALLIIRMAENETRKTWYQIKQILSTLTVGIHRTKDGEVWQTNPTKKEQKSLFKAVKLTPPPRYLKIPIAQ